MRNYEKLEARVQSLKDELNAKEVSSQFFLLIVPGINNSTQEMFRIIFRLLLDFQLLRSSDQYQFVNPVLSVLNNVRVMQLMVEIDLIILKTHHQYNCFITNTSNSQYLETIFTDLNAVKPDFIS